MRSESILNYIVSNAVIACMIFLFASCAKEESFPEIDLEKRESILDRVVYIEPKLITVSTWVMRNCMWKKKGKECLWF